MARRSKKDDPEVLRRKLVDLLQRFEHHLKSGNLRNQVKELVPAHHHLRDLGSSLINEPDTESGRDRILAYLKKYAGEVLAGGELMVVAGIDDYARRIRELRVQFGWAILSGVSSACCRKAFRMLSMIPVSGATLNTEIHGVGTKIQQGGIAHGFSKLKNGMVGLVHGYGHDFR